MLNLLFTECWFRPFSDSLISAEILARLGPKSFNHFVVVPQMANIIFNFSFNVIASQHCCFHPSIRCQGLNSRPLDHEPSALTTRLVGLNLLKGATLINSVFFIATQKNLNTKKEQINLKLSLGYLETNSTRYQWHRVYNDMVGIG